MSGRAFTARYRESVLFVSTPALIGAPVVGIATYALLHSLAGALAAGALCLVLATLFVSAAKRARPALRLSADGAQIDGLTLLEWRALDRVRILSAADDDDEDDDSLGMPGALEVRFARRGAWPDGLRAIGPSPLWRSFDGGLVLRLALLEDAPDTVAEAFNYFLRQRGASAKTLSEKKPDGPPA